MKNNVFRFTKQCGSYFPSDLILKSRFDILSEVSLYLESQRSRFEIRQTVTFEYRFTFF